MRPDEAITAATVEELRLTLAELALACAVSDEWIVARVREGAIVGVGEDPAAWRFTVRDVRRVRQIRTLERDFGAAPEIAALVADG